MKKILVLMIIELAMWGMPAFAQSASVVKNLGTDADVAAANQSSATCNLYRGAVLVTNQSVVRVTSPASVACKFVGVTLSPSETYTAAYVSALGFEGPKSDPFLTDSVPGKPGTALHPVP